MGATTSLMGRGIVLGLGAAIPIGPVNVEIARRTLRGGFFRGFALGCGAVSADCAYAVISSVSLGRLLQRPAIQWPITIGGIVFLLYLSYLCLTGARRDWHTDPISDEGARSGSPGSGYLAGLLMTLLNPMTLGFWFLVLPTTPRGLAQDRAHDLPLICVGVFFGTISWVLTFSGGLHWAGRWRRRWWLAAADLLGGFTLLCFAGAGIWHALRPLL